MTYDVIIVRKSYAYKTVRVSASNKVEARDKALEDAGNHIYDEKDADYEVEEINVSSDILAAEKEILEAYTFLRTNNQSIPDNIIDLMKDSALKALRD